MTGWEYCRVALIRRETDTGLVAIVVLDYFQNLLIEDDPAPWPDDQTTGDAMFTLDTTVARPGAEGWEAISIDDQGLRWYFKRPLPE
jgi:hypothetical protein